MSKDPKALVLIVDAEADSRREIAACVPANSYRTAEVEMASDARRAAAEELPHLVIAEVRLPDASGFSLCRELRENRDTRDISVILLSSWSSEMDRIFAFECGADDFVARPFSRRELTSRIGALGRHRLRKSPLQARHRGGASGALVRVEPNSPPSASRILSRAQNLTSKETSILIALVQADGRPLSRDELVRQVWGPTAGPSPRCIDSHVKSLRRKIATDEGRIETLRGVGYRFSGG